MNFKAMINIRKHLSQIIFNIYLTSLFEIEYIIDTVSDDLYFNHVVRVLYYMRVMSSNHYITIFSV